MACRPATPPTKPQESPGLFRFISISTSSKNLLRFAQGTRVASNSWQQVAHLVQISHSLACMANTTSLGAMCRKYLSVVARDAWPSCCWITGNGTPSIISS